MLKECEFKHSNDADKVEEELKYVKYNLGLLGILQIK